MDLGVRGKVAFINGGGEGIGQLSAIMLADEGADIIITDMNEENANTTAEMVRERGRKCLSYQVDVTNQEQVTKTVQAAVAEFGKIDILLHIPGRGERKSFMAGGKDDWDFSINLNLYGPLYVAKAVVAQMVEQKSGSLVFIVSDAGRVGELNNSVYSAAKGGVIAFSKSIAKELGRYNIRANCVALSAMNTPAGLRSRGEIFNASDEEIKEIEKKVLKNYSIRRFGEPEDAASALCFLASDRASWITGQTLSVNGGYCMT